MKAITAICLFSIFVIGVWVGKANLIRPVDDSRLSEHSLGTSVANSPDLSEFRSQLSALQDANADLKRQYHELKGQLSASAVVVSSSDAANYESADSDLEFAMEITEPVYTTGGVSQDAFVESEEQNFYSNPMDSAQTSISYESLKMNLLGSQWLQHASLQNMECRGDSCLIQINQPVQQGSDEEGFNRQFELAALLRDSGFTSSLTLKTSAGSMTLISKY